MHSRTNGFSEENVHHHRAILQSEFTEARFKFDQCPFSFADIQLGVSIIRRSAIMITREK